MFSAETEYIEVAVYEALDRLIDFARFMDRHPEELGKTTWLGILKNHIKLCGEQIETVHQGKHIVCILNHDRQWNTNRLDRINLFALPFDILCCRDTKKSDNLEPVHSVVKVVQQEGNPQQEVGAELKPDDMLVVLSYSTDAQECVKEEIQYVIEWFKLALSISEDKVLKIGSERMPLSHDRYTKRVDNARILWMHNIHTKQVAHYLRLLPGTRNVIFHYIGPVREDALNPGLRYGGRISGVKLKRDLDLLSGARIVKLFYVSPHHGSGKRQAFLRYDMEGFVYELLRGAQLARMVWFRWLVAEEAVTIMTKLFYDELGDVPGCASQALLEAKNMAYNEWKGDSERYYAWAAPVLITQGCDTTPFDKPSPPTPALLYYKEGLELVGEERSKALEQLESHFEQKHLKQETYKTLRQLILDQILEWEKELGTEDEPSMVSDIREIENRVHRFPEAVEDLILDILDGQLPLMDLEETFKKLVEQLCEN